MVSSIPSTPLKKTSVVAFLVNLLISKVHRGYRQYKINSMSRDCQYRNNLYM